MIKPMTSGFAGFGRLQEKARSTKELSLHGADVVRLEPLR